MTPQMDNGDMRERCYFAELGPCDGPLQRAHWIPKQRLRLAGLTEDGIWDERLWRPLCHAHHHRADHKFLAVTTYPASLIEWADEHNWFFVDSRTGWRAAAVAEHSA